MEKLNRKQPVKSEEEKTIIQAHFEVRTNETSSEAIDMLASIIANHIERRRKNE